MGIKQPPNNPNPKPRRLTPCHRHPNLPVTTLCPHCLRERLSQLNPSTSASSSASSSSSSAADSSAAAAAAGGGVEPVSSNSTTSSSSTAAALPELRRCKTFSGKNCDIVVGFEPRRRSCEVRSRSSTLEALFSVDDRESGGDRCGFSSLICESAVVVESKNLGILKGTYPVPELREEDEDEEDESDCEIRVSSVVDDALAPNVGAIGREINNADDDEEFEDSRPMKEFIDLEFESKRRPVDVVGRDLKEIAGSFWIAASVFSKKLQKWKKKQKTAVPPPAAAVAVAHEDGNGGRGHGFAKMRLKKSLGGRRRRRTGETQTEAGEYDALGRRSCDTDPRVSVDLGWDSVDGRRFSVDGIGSRVCDANPSCSFDQGRASIDCGRISIEEDIQGGGSFTAPRASWDGYLIGRPAPQSTAAAAATPMVSVIENAMATVYGFDHRALVLDKLNAENEDGRRRSFDGYGYFDSAAKPKKGLSFGLDRSNSTKGNVNVNMTTNMVARQDDGEAKPGFHTKKLPPPPIELFHGTKLLITEKELMGSRMSSMRDDSSGSFDTSSSSNMNSSASSSSAGNGSKKPRKWGKLLNALGLFAHRKQGNDGEMENHNVTDAVDHSVAVAVRNNMKDGFGNNSVISSRSSSMVLKKREDAIFERNRSAKYSPNHLDNGLLRFYLTPSRGSRTKSARNGVNRSHSLARNVLKM